MVGGEEQQSSPEGDQKQLPYHTKNAMSLRAGVTGETKEGGGGRGGGGGGGGG